MVGLAEMGARGGSIVRQAVRVVVNPLAMAVATRPAGLPKRHAILEPKQKQAQNESVGKRKQD